MNREIVPQFSGIGNDRVAVVTLSNPDDRHFTTEDMLAMIRKYFPDVPYDDLEIQVRMTKDPSIIFSIRR